MSRAHELHKEIAQHADALDLPQEAYTRLLSDKFVSWRLALSDFDALTVEEITLVFTLPKQSIFVLFPRLKTNVYALGHPLFSKTAASPQWMLSCARLAQFGGFYLIRNKVSVSETVANAMARLANTDLFPAVANRIVRDVAAANPSTCIGAAFLYAVCAATPVAAGGTNNHAFIECVRHVASLFTVSARGRADAVRRTVAAKPAPESLLALATTFLPALGAAAATHQIYLCTMCAAPPCADFPMRVPLNNTEMLVVATHRAAVGAGMPVEELETGHFSVGDCDKHGMTAAEWIGLGLVYHGGNGDDAAAAERIFRFYTEKLKKEQTRVLLPLLALDAAEYEYNSNMAGKDIVQLLFPDVKTGEKLNPMTILSRVIDEHVKNGAPLRLPMETLVKFARRLGQREPNRARLDSQFVLDDFPCPAGVHPAAWAAVNCFPVEKLGGEKAKSMSFLDQFVAATKAEMKQ